jgi:hypothetical protein
MKKIFILLLQVFCCLLLQGNSMADTQRIKTTILNLNENEFFNADSSVLTPLESRLLDMGCFGIAVNAPDLIITSRRDKLPLIMAVSLSGGRDWDVPMSDNCILVGTDLQDGSVHFAKAFVDKKELQNRGIKKKAPRGPKPSGLVSSAAKLIELDPLDRLDIEWNTGTWRLGVLYYDWPSNTVDVELIGDKKVMPAPVMEIYPEPDLKADGFLPWYLPTAQTPPCPDLGLTFTSEFNVEGEKQQLNIFGSFALTTRDFYLPTQKSVHKFHDQGQKSVAAVVPLTLAVLGLDWDKPLQFDWAVPVYGEPLAVGMLARGSFSIDALAEDTITNLDPGKYICYIVMDGRIFGPKIINVSKN